MSGVSKVQEAEPNKVLNEIGEYRYPASLQDLETRYLLGPSVRDEESSPEH